MELLSANGAGGEGMRKLFTEDGLRLLEAFCLNDSLLAFDFDGTLAGIVEKPEDARMTPAVQKYLGALDRLGTVAIVSGRGRRDLGQRLGLDLRHMIGNHGMEGLPSSAHHLERARLACQDWDHALESALQLIPGSALERKTYSVSVHYRKCRAKKAARERWLRACGHLRPSPRIILGKDVINLVPPGSPHKGVALLELMVHLERKSAIYVGDDDTDEDVFSLPNPQILGIRVGQRRDSQAGWYIERQRDIGRLLRTLLTYRAQGR